MISLLEPRCRQSVADPLTIAVNGRCAYIVPMASKDQDQRGAAKGSFGNKPHERDEEVAILVRELAGFGMPQDEISRALNAAKGGGFSVDTLDRHYREELDHGLAAQKTQLLRRAHKIAMGEEVLTKLDEEGNPVPSGVTPDAAFRESAATTRWLLGAVHRVRDGVEHDFGAGTINVTISPDDAEL